MEVKIEIDASKLTNEVAGIFSVLTPEEKKAMAREVILKYLMDAKDHDRAAKELEMIAKIRSESSYRNDTDESIRGNWKFRDEMSKYKSLKETLVASLIDEVKLYAKEQIADLVKNDAYVKAATEETTLFVKENFSKFVHDAMIAWFCQNMNLMTSGVQQALNQSDNLSKYTSDLNQRLLNKGI